MSTPPVAEVGALVRSVGAALPKNGGLGRRTVASGPRRRRRKRLRSPTIPASCSALKQPLTRGQASLAGMWPHLSRQRLGAAVVGGVC